MEVKKAIKRIVALGAGVSMMGATLFGAMAADLSEYPAPFVKGGVFDALIVVGESAATNDVLGAIDISNNLQASMTKSKVVSGASSSVTVTGDSKKLEQSTNKFELNGELGDSISSSITSSDMKALADGKFDNDFGTFDYTQTIDVAKSKVIYAIDPDDTTDTPAQYLWFPSTSKSYEYKISFSPALKSDHNTAGTDYLDDVKNKKITFLGKTYTILGAEHSGTNKVKLTFMAGAVQDLLDEGASKSYTLEGKPYDVTVSVITTSEVKFVVNSETTDSTAEGSTYRLSDGIEIGVVDILENEAGEAAGGDKVEFTLGAKKIVIDDADTSNTAYDATVSIGTTDMSNVKADIKTSSDAGTSDGADVKISDIKIRYNASQELYIPKDGKLSTVAETIEGEDGVLFADGFDVEFKGLEVAKTEEIKLKPSGSNNYKLEWTNKNGQVYNLEMFGYNSAAGSKVTLGKLSGSTIRDIVVHENELIGDEEYFIISKNGYSHIMQFKDVNTANSIIKVQDAAVGGSTYEVTFTSLAGDLNLDGNTFRVNLTGLNDSIAVDLDGDTTFEGGQTVVNGSMMAQSSGKTVACTGTDSTTTGLVTKYGACISIGVVSSTTSGENNTILITTEKTEDTEYNTTAVTLHYDATNSQLEIANLSGKSWDHGGTSGMQIGSSDDYEMYDGYGTKGHWFKATSGADTFTWTYPDNQVSGAVFYTAGTIETASAGGETTSQEVVKINVGAAVLDTDPLVDGKETTKNLIVVGGPAINKAAAVLMGKPFPSYGAASGVPENAAIVKLVENGDNVAMIVAGWAAEDSQRAARVVASHSSYTGFKGKEIKVTGTTLSDMTVSAVTTS